VTNINAKQVKTSFGPMADTESGESSTMVFILGRPTLGALVSTDGTFAVC
jgi:hypothetical protein